MRARTAKRPTMAGGPSLTRGAAESTQHSGPCCQASKLLLSKQVSVMVHMSVWMGVSASPPRLLELCA